MTKAALRDELRKLSLAERLELVEELWDSIAASMITNPSRLLPSSARTWSGGSPRRTRIPQAERPGKRCWSAFGNARDDAGRPCVLDLSALGDGMIRAHCTALRGVPRGASGRL